MAACSFLLSSRLLHPSQSLPCPPSTSAYPLSVCNLLGCCSTSFTASNFLFSHHLLFPKLTNQIINLHHSQKTKCRATLEALVFDCDGVILESEDLHRCAYNATFAHFDVSCPGFQSPVNWSTEFYDDLQNRIGGGKPKMRWYFNLHGWPSCSTFPSSPQTDDEKTALIDALQDWKTKKYKDIIASGAVAPRPGVLRLMDEARGLGIKLAVCSAATKSSVIFCLTNLLGKEKFLQLDCFIAGDDVEKKKPDPLIYQVAAEKLRVEARNCLVVEDSVIGLQAALGAGMNCIISFTASTANKDFKGAKAVFSDLGAVGIEDLLKLVEAAPAVL